MTKTGYAFPHDWDVIPGGVVLHQEPLLLDQTTPETVTVTPAVPTL